MASAAACAAQTTSSSDDAVGQSSSAIAAVVPGQADLAGIVRMGEPAVVRAALASGKILGTAGQCTATMIGPNIVMTASHCGDPIHFEHIANSNDRDDRGQLRELFPCHALLNTFPETDLMLGYCENNDDGESPGLKYGYLDFDLVFNNRTVDYAKSKALVSVGTNVYSFWWNPVDNLNDDMELLYSPGSIHLVNTGTGWYNPAPVVTSDPDLGQCSDADDSVGVALDIYAAGGCSGSSVLSATRDRIIAGPTSIAAGSTARGMLPIIEYLDKAIVQTPDSPSCGRTGESPMINGTLIHDRWNLTAASFKGHVDADHTGVFDIEESIELKEGEHPRTAYWFDFDSSRQNQLWGGRGAGISTQRGMAVGSSTGSTWQKFAKHDLLHLKPHTKYRVTARVASTRQFRVCLENDCITSDATSFGLDMFTRAGGILDSGANGELSFWGFAAGETRIDSVAIVEMGSVSDFSTADQRDSWKGAQASDPTISELATSGANVADFTGVVRAGTWTLASENLPFSRGTHRVCFDARVNPLVTQSGGKLRVQVTEDGVFRASAVLSAGQNLCTPSFNLVGDVGEIQFGGDNGGSFLVDNITIQ